MKLKLQFGLDQGVEYVPYWYRDILDFPKYIRYQGIAYEWCIYEKATSSYFNYDYSLTFSKTRNYPGNFWELPSFEVLFPNNIDEKCSCGSKFDRDNPKYHYSYCRLSKK